MKLINADTKSHQSYTWNSSFLYSSFWYHSKNEFMWGASWPYSLSPRYDLVKNTAKSERAARIGRILVLWILKPVLAWFFFWNYFESTHVKFLHPKWKHILDLSLLKPNTLYIFCFFSFLKIYLNSYCQFIEFGPKFIQLMNFERNQDSDRFFYNTSLSIQDNVMFFFRFPKSKGVAGYVATTGETLNITDAYHDERFNRWGTYSWAGLWDWLYRFKRWGRRVSWNTFNRN